MVHAGVAHGAEQQLGEAAAAAGADDQRICALGPFGEDLGRGALDGVHGQPGGAGLALEDGVDRGTGLVAGDAAK